ncbi:hypothetical protein XH87_10440 [Bradyrhizobium sp. CCBAU 53415]|nr:hypothetical protein [Bradyrhizobium sp. CCBAU 53415]
MRFPMVALLIEHNALGIQCTQVAGGCQQDAIEYLKSLIRRSAGQQGPRKRNRRTDVVRLLLQRIAQLLLISIPAEGVRDALAHGGINGCCL